MGRAGGAVTLVGGDIHFTGDINTSGSDAVAGVGGAGRAVSLNATDGTPTIMLNGNITAQGGTGIRWCRRSRRCGHAE